MILAREAGLGLDVSTPRSQSFPHTHTPISAAFSQLPLNIYWTPNLIPCWKGHSLRNISTLKSLSSSSSNLAPNFQPHLIAAPVILVFWLTFWLPSCLLRRKIHWYFLCLHPHTLSVLALRKLKVTALCCLLRQAPNKHKPSSTLFWGIFKKTTFFSCIPCAEMLLLCT